MKLGTGQVQIICTIGPACRSPKRIEDLIRAGMNVARLHFSYSPQSEHAENIRRIHGTAYKLGRKIVILQDLSGSKVRLGKFGRNSAKLTVGKPFTLTSRPVQGNASMASVNIPELIPVIKAHDKILLADGALILEALSSGKTDVRCRVIIGGTLKSEQAVHVVGKSAPVKVPTLKDFDDVRFGIQNGVDWIAQSYATEAGEIQRLRQFIQQQGAHIPIVAKIERRIALKNLKQLVHSADLVMVARGDLGIELDLTKNCLAQKRIIACAKRARRPVIVGTELMFSMMDKNRPTRAEVADVTNAVLDGADALMLSGETAMGRFPIETTRALRKICEVVQKTKSKRALYG